MRDRACEACGGRIGGGRLEAVPSATRCVGCERREPSQRPRSVLDVDVEEADSRDLARSAAAESNKSK